MPRPVPSLSRACRVPRMHFIVAVKSRFHAVSVLAAKAGREVLVGSARAMRACHVFVAASRPHHAKPARKSKACQHNA